MRKTLLSRITLESISDCRHNNDISAGLISCFVVRPLSGEEKHDVEEADNCCTDELGVLSEYKLIIDTLRRI